MGATEDAAARRVIAGEKPEDIAGRGTLRSGTYSQALVSSQCEPVGGERLLDLLDRLLAEVRDRGQLVLGLRDEIADRLDADALQAVVRADPSSSSSIGKFSIPWASETSAGPSATAASPKPS